MIDLHDSCFFLFEKRTAKFNWEVREMIDKTTFSTRNDFEILLKFFSLATRLRQKSFIYSLKAENVLIGIKRSLP